MRNTTTSEPQQPGQFAPAPGSASLIEKMIESHPLIGSRERHNIRRALDAGEAYGYGNIMAWLATAWAVKLRDESGLSEAAAIEAVSNRTPYALPPNARTDRRGRSVASELPTDAARPRSVQ